MVARVYGKYDGQRIVFTQKPETGRWETAVPFNSDGEYVVEIWAADECGNESYYATLLFTVDTAALCVKIKILDLSVQARKDGAFQVKTSRYNAHIFKCERCGEDGKPIYRAKPKIKRWKAEVVKCELCGRF